MKKFIYALLSIITISSCQDVIEVDVPNSEPRLVIDASFEFYLNENPTTIEGYLRLTKSAPFFDSEIPSVDNAIVYITNLTDNSVINFELSDNPGYYTPVGNAELNPQFNTTYELTVEYEGEVYKATTQIYPSATIDSIEQGDGTLFGENETEIILTFTDDAARDDFYLFDFGFNELEVSEDRFYQGETFTFSYFYEDIEPGNEITIKILGIEEQYFNYATILIEQSNQGGDPFATVPALLRGNIINTTNTDNYALGYFNLSEANRLSYIIQE